MYTKYLGINIEQNNTVEAHIWKAVLKICCGWIGVYHSNNNETTSLVPEVFFHHKERGERKKCERKPLVACSTCLILPCRSENWLEEYFITVQWTLDWLLLTEGCVVIDSHHPQPEVFFCHFFLPLGSSLFVVKENLWDQGNVQYILWPDDTVCTKIIEKLKFSILTWPPHILLAFQIIHIHSEVTLAVVKQTF